MCCKPWPAIQADAVIAANLLHISPAAVLPALMAGAGGLLGSGCVLHIYGPFLRDGQFTSESNAAFDASLRRRDPDWGLRDLDDVVRAAQASGFSLEQIREMPANNFSLTFRKSG